MIYTSGSDSGGARDEGCTISSSRQRESLFTYRGIGGKKFILFFRKAVYRFAMRWNLRYPGLLAWRGSAVKLGVDSVKA